ncbi:MAG: DUF86 domain-containing protein [Candidatus Methanofastidiosia archaeon]
MNNRILEKLSEAKESVALVRKNLPNSYEEFLSMKKLERDGIYKNIEFAIQNILDMCAMLIKDEDLTIPGSDDDILTELQNADVLDDDVIKTIKKMKGFRNFLVHRYGSIDNEIAYNDIKDGLKDFTVIFKNIRDIVT